MPSLGSGYTFEDFLQRLERSPVSHMSPLYHAHSELFKERPDMFTRAVMAISWERALALVDAAYYVQPIQVETYRGVLARMLLHNKHVQRSGAGELVSWKAATRVFSEAILHHGNAVPTRMSVSALRLLAPHRQAGAALGILQLAQANEKLTKPMIVDAAHACASPSHWSEALKLLMHVHGDDPALLSGAIQSLRPPGTDALSVQEARQSLLPGSGAAPPPSPEQRHILRVLGDVVASVPWEVAMRHELCHSYLTHLAACTTLSAGEKTLALSRAVASLPLEATVELLTAYTEPNLLEEKEWADALKRLPHPTPKPATAEKSRKKGKKSKKAAQSLRSSEQVDSTEEQLNQEAPAVTTTESDSVTVLSTSEAAAVAVRALRCHSQWLQCPPEAVATLLAVLIGKLPDSSSAAECIRLCTSSAVSTSTSSDSIREAAGGEHHIHSPAHHSLLSGAAQHPVVRSALLQKCCEDAHEGWRVASALLLAQGAATTATPVEALSTVVLQLRQAKQVSLVVRVLQEHIVPTGARLTPPALEALFACILAHNRAVHTRQLEGGSDATTANDDSSVERAVHWKSALSWATDLQAPTAEERIAVTGTGQSGGAVSRRPTEVVRAEKALSPSLLSLVVHICVDAGSPEGALQALGHARKVNKTELKFSEQIRAVLYCMMYDRPYEAEAIVRQAVTLHGAEAAAPLQQLLTLAQSAKQREGLSQKHKIAGEL